MKEGEESSEHSQSRRSSVGGEAEGLGFLPSPRLSDSSNHSGNKDKTGRSYSVCSTKGGDLRTSFSSLRSFDLPDDLSVGTYTKKEGSGDPGDMQILNYETVQESYSCPDGPASSLRSWGTGTAWKGSTYDGYIVLKLSQPSLISYLRIHNRKTGVISVSLAVRGEGRRKREYVNLRSDVRLPHGYIKEIPIGHLPGMYIRIDCKRGCSLYAVQVVGYPLKELKRSIGPQLEKLVYKGTKELLYGPSLKEYLPPVSNRAAREKLLLPHSRFRFGEGWSEDCSSISGESSLEEEESSVHEQPRH